MKKRLTGHFIPVSTVGETVKAFIPKPLPPDPPLKIGDKLRGSRPSPARPWPTGQRRFIFAGYRLVIIPLYSQGGGSFFTD